MRVLLADNNLSNRLVARTVLERENHIVTSAANGAEAISRLQSEPYDVLLLDIVMPVMDGFQTVEYISETSGRPTFVFALSAYDTPDDVKRYRKAGFDGLITKPLRRGDLHTALTANASRLGRMTVGFAANLQDAAARPLLDEMVLRDGPTMADDITRERIWRSYRQDLSSALKDMSNALPGFSRGESTATVAFAEALHTLRSASLSVGMDRAPFLAKQLRELPSSSIVEGVANLLWAVRESLPELEKSMSLQPSVATR